MTRPEDPIPEWATGDDAQIETPAGGEIDAGWKAGDSPPAEYVNWFWSGISRWVSYLRDAFEAQHKPNGAHKDVTADTVSTSSVTVHPVSGGYNYASPVLVHLDLSPALMPWLPHDPAATGSIVPSATNVPGVRKTGSTNYQIRLGINHLLPRRPGTEITLKEIEIEFSGDANADITVQLMRNEGGPLFPPTTLASGKWSGPGAPNLITGETILLENIVLFSGDPTFLVLTFDSSTAAESVVVHNLTLHLEKTQVE